MFLDVPDKVASRIGRETNRFLLADMEKRMADVGGGTHGMATAARHTCRRSGKSERRAAVSYNSRRWIP